MPADVMIRGGLPLHVLIVAESERDPRITCAHNLLTRISDISNVEITCFDDAVKICFHSDPYLVLVLLQNIRAGHELIHRLRERFEGHILAAGSLADPKAIQRSLQVGADEVLDEDSLEEHLEAVVWQLLGRRPFDKGTGQCICVVSASGGCGASTLAVNIAAILATKQKQCVLIDLNAWGGDLPALLDLKPQFSLVDLGLVESRLDQAMLDKILVRHDSGIRLLGSPLDPVEMRQLTPQGIRNILELVQKWFRCAIVDIEDIYQPEQLEVLRHATGVLLVTRLTFSSITRTRRLLKQLGGLGIRGGRVQVVINQRGQPNELELEDAEQALGIKLTHQIPYDPKLFNTANNTGRPAVLCEPGSRIAKCIAKLAELRFEA
jgi:pilus assembly protein CpaE